MALGSHASFFSVPLLEAGAFPGQLVAASRIQIEENFWTINTLRTVCILSQTLEIALPGAKTFYTL